jgi:hypothetical protein
MAGRRARALIPPFNVSIVLSDNARRQIATEPGASCAPDRAVNFVSRFRYFRTSVAIRSCMPYDTVGTSDDRLREVEFFPRLRPPALSPSYQSKA